MWEPHIQRLAIENCVWKILVVIESDIADSDVFYTSWGTWPFYEK